MKAICLPTQQRISPYGDLASEMPVLNQPLHQVQRRALLEAGVALVDEPPTDESYLVFSDRTWFTAELVRLLCAAGVGRLQVTHAGWWEATGALQALPSPGLYEMGVVAAGQAPTLQLPPRALDLSFTEMDPPRVHASMRHALRPLFSSAAMVHQIDHWSHIVRVNQLAIAGRAEAARLAFERAGFFRKVAMIASILWRAKSLRRDRIVDALTERPRGVNIHPTAVVELCVLGEDVEIGPHAVVRASIIGDGARIEEHATVNLSSIGNGANVGRFAMVNLSTLMDGAMVSCGGGYQCCVFGKDAFVAWGATILDLSFGRPVQVRSGGQRMDSGQHFLGAAVGHRARIGNAVRISYGVEVANDAFLVPPKSGLIRDASDAPAHEAACWTTGGGVKPIREKKSE